jgi:DnaJ-class molecular chaperone
MVTCPACAGQSTYWFTRCGACENTGRLPARAAVYVAALLVLWHIGVIRG